MAQTSWTDADFDRISWHDNHVHGFRIEEGEHGTCTLFLDIDHIVEWLPPEDDRFSFMIAPATLAFTGVFGLKIHLDWATIGAGMTPFSLSQITRTRLDYPGWSWAIEVNWPEGVISFEATGFTQVLRGAPIRSWGQCLTTAERGSVLPGA